MSEDQTGGNLIAEGKFGCVFDTVPRCKGRARTIRDGRFSRNQRKTRRVVKIMDVKDKTIATEINISRHLSQIENYKDYFILIDDVCVGDDMTEDKDWSKCGIFRPGVSRRAPFVQLRMLHGGIRLTEYALNIDRLLKNWVNIQIHLALALRILHTRNWVHGDFHFGNIVVDDKDVPRIIDFGLSYNLTRLQEKDIINMTFLPSYDNYAPELDYAAGVLTNKSKRSVMEQIYYRKHILKEIDEMFPAQSGVLDELNGFAERHDLVSGGDIVSFLQKYGTMADMWTFGFDFYKLYMLMLSVPSVINSAFYKGHHATQMRILRGLLQPDPRKRFSADNLLTELYALRMATA